MGQIFQVRIVVFMVLFIMNNYRMDSQIPYFCGDSLECRTFGNPEALEQAKKNVEEKFVMVGTIDSLSKSHSVM